MAYDRISPIGELRADLRSAMLLTMLSNGFRDEKDEPARIEEFMLEDFGTTAAQIETQDERPSMTDEQIWESLKMQFNHPSLRK